MSSNTAVSVTFAVIAGLLGLGIGYAQSHHEGISSQPDISKSIQQLTMDAAAVPIEGSPIRGGVNAETTVVVFTDWTVPATRPVYLDYLDHAFKVHGEKLAVVYKAYPLADNEDALFKAKFAGAAQLQGNFWKIADILAQKGNAPLDKSQAYDLALKAGLDVKRLAKDLDSQEVISRIQRDIALGQRLGLKGAPSIFVNGRALNFTGNITDEALLDGINAEAQRVNRLKNLPTSNYYLGSLINQHLEQSAQATDELGRPVRGAKNALVTIVEYSDYECPFCSRVEPTIARILREYPDSVRVVFSHNPLPFHQHAMGAHKAAYAAGKQGKFWEMHDILFQNQKALTEPSLLNYAKRLGLNMDQFKADMASPETEAAIQRDLKEGTAREISGTPNFLINGELVTGAKPYEAFKTVIDKQMKIAISEQRRTGLSGEKLYQSLIGKAQPARRPGVNAEPPGTRLFVDISGAPALGAPDAPVTIVEFTDFECPFCSRGNTTIKKLMEQNPGKVRLVFKNNPLSMHKHADGAHRAAVAAGIQGKFWEMYQLLFDNQKKLGQSDLEEYAKQLGLDVAKFKADMESEDTKQRVAADLAQGESLGVRGTPHFFINGKRVSGALPIERFQSMLDEELATAQKYIDKGVAGDALYRTIIDEETKAHLNRRVMKKARLEAAKAPVELTQGDSYARGPANAPVTIYQFSEFQCPFCMRVEPTIAQIVETYGDKVRVVFKNFPLAFHKNAKLASEAVLAAGAQGKFWEMHKVLFDNQKALERQNLSEYAKQIGLDVSRFDADLDSHKYAAQVEKEQSEGQGAGVTGTPTFFINGKVLSGAQPFDAFKDAIDAALK